MKANRGEARRFFQMAMVYESDECCIWPFARNKFSGYAFMSLNGEYGSTHRFICEAMHGAPPSEIHEAAHSCGNGNLGCINHRHLSWKTPKENAADRESHGTVMRGEKNGHAILTDEKVIAIRNMFGSVPSHEIAKIFCVSQQLICDIKKNRRWSHVVGGK